MVDGAARRRRDPMALFVTGAGLSADSGVPTFRGSDGLYNGIRAEELMSARTMRSSPSVIHEFCDARREALEGVMPNAAHRMIAALEADYPGRVVHCSQNIDHLGSPSTVQLHGRLSRMRSIGNSKVLEEIGFARYWSGPPEKAPPRGYRFRCPKSGSLFRPDVVLFDELAPEYAKLWKALRGLRRGDVLVVIGTQGSVLPVSQMARKAPCLSVLNNLHRSGDIDEGDFGKVLLRRASEAAAEIDGIVRTALGPAPAAAALPVPNS